MADVECGGKNEATQLAKPKQHKRYRRKDELQNLASIMKTRLP